MICTVKPGKAFVFTVNNPVGVLEFPEGTKYVYQLEMGENGTCHYQGYCIFSKVMRLSGLKKVLATAHWENRKGSHEQAYDYCVKESTRIEPPIIYMERDHHSGKRSDLLGARARILALSTYGDIVRDPELEEVLAKYPRWVKDVHVHRPIPLLEGVSLRPWQVQLDLKLSDVPDARKIYWVHDSIGNCGKSWMATYLARNRGALVVTGGKASDIAHAYDNHGIVVFDLARATDFNCVSYAAMEDLKNGRIFSPKYDSCVKFFPIPHMVVFANAAPPADKFSADRLEVIDLDAKRKDRMLNLYHEGMNVYSGSYVDTYAPHLMGSITEVLDE